MAEPTIPRLKDDSKEMEKLNRLPWAAGLSLTAYGASFGIRATDPVVLEELPDFLPPGAEVSPEPVVDRLYSVVVAGTGPDRDRGRGRRTSHEHLVYAEAELIGQAADLRAALNRMESFLQVNMAAAATEGLFIHAGVVGWQGKAIVIPGRSFDGKTSLVVALLKAGATYYSDEYAILDEAGLVSPYPRLLSVRDEQKRQRKCRPEEFGCATGVERLPIGLIVDTHYEPGSKWDPRPLTPGEALMKLLDNTVAARIRRQHTLPILQKAVLKTKAIQSPRPDVEEVVQDLLSLVDAE